MAMYNKIVVGRFAKGITDKPEDGDVNAAAKLDNVVLRDNATSITRTGSWVFKPYAYRTPNLKDIKKVLEYDDDSVFLAGEKAYLDNGTSLEEKKSVNTAIDIFPDNGADNYFSSFSWKNQFIVTSNQPGRPVKIFKDDDRGWQIITEGLPAATGALSMSVTGGEGEVSYALGVCFKYDYKIKGVDYSMRGPLSISQVTGQTSVGGITYNNVPELVNDVDTHYDITNVDVELYRTVEDGSILYLDETLSNGVTGASTAVTGEGITANARSYRDGGVLSNDPPPKCKIVIEANNFAYYLALEEDPSKGLESKANRPYAVPAGNSFELDREISAAAVIYDDVFVMTKYKWYRLDGHFTDTGTGGVVPRVVSNSDGVLYHQSVDNGSEGAFATGLKGFVFCDGNNVTTISDFDEKYKELLDNSSETNQIVGTFDRIKKRMFFSCKNKSQAEQNDSLYVFHEKLWAINSTYKAFTTWSGGKYFYPTYIQFLDDNNLFRGDNNGYMLKHDSKYKYDPQYKSSTLPTSWNKNPIIEDIITSYLFGQDQSVRNWGCKVLTRAANLTNLSIQPSVAQDGAGNFKPMNKIDVRTQITWAEPNLYWKSTKDSYWKDSREIRRMTNMPSGFARFFSRQLRYKRGFSIIYEPAQNYATTVTVDALAKTFKFNGSVPVEVLEKYIFFGPDFSTRFYIIQAVNLDTFKISDPGNDLVSGTYDWIIKGFPTGQLFNLLEAVLFYVSYGSSADHTGQSGIEAK